MALFLHKFWEQNSPAVPFNASCVCMHAKSFHVWLCVTLCIIAHQAPLSTEFSRQECYSWLPCAPSGGLPDTGIEPASLKSPALAGRFLTTSTTFIQFTSVQFLSHVWLFGTPWITACQASLSITNSWSLLKLMSVDLVMPSSHLILCHPLLLLHPIPPRIRVFSKESTLRKRWPKYWSFSFSISPSNEHPGLISFRMDWLDLLGVQGTLKTLLQHHSSKAPIFWHSAFFTVQLSHPHIHDHWKNHSLG